MELPILIISLMLSAFFSGVEIAFVTADKLMIELKSRQGTFSGKILGRFLASPSQFIGTTLIGNNIALVIFGVSMAKLLEDPLKNIIPGPILSDFTVLLLQTIISTAVVLLAGEFIPKILFRINPNGALRLFSLPLILVYFLLYPVAYVIIWLSKKFLQVFLKTNLEDKETSFSRIDLEFLLKDTSDKSRATELDTELFENALYFVEVKVRECMVPRLEIVSVEETISITDIKKKFLETGLSRILVYKGSIDNIIGYVHHHDMLHKPEKLKSILKTILIIPETLSAKELLDKFINERQNIAWVVDEFGGTAGIVTLEDVLEEIFGEIEDEHDVEEFVEQKLSKNEYIFSGRLEIDYLNEKYKLDLPEGEYETLAGFIVKVQEDIPKVNESIRVDKFRFLITSVSETRIETVRMTIMDS